MKKLIKGIIDFREHRLADYREKFAQLAQGQSPDTLFIACSDSRVVPNLFASTDPGDLFVVRNVGNIVPPCCEDAKVSNDKSVSAAIEFSVKHLNVSDIIICGHSDCGAVKAILQGREKVSETHLQDWLEYGEQASSMLPQIDFGSEDLSELNKVSRANVLLQLKQLGSYPLIEAKIQSGQLKLHGWWFDIASGNVYSFDKASKNFQLIEA